MGIAFGLLTTLASADVVTVLSSDVAQVGQPVVLVYRFVNTGMPEDMPRPSIAVNGLEIRYNGMQQQSRMSWNFGGGGNRSSNESVYEFHYMVVPSQPGEFTIPSFDVRAEGKLIRTKPVTLRVVGGGGYTPQVPTIPSPRQMIPPAPQMPNAPQSSSRNRQPSSGNNAPYYGEIVMGSKTAFVGEVIPVELRFYFRADTSFDNLQRPSFGGEGFTSIPLSEPEQTTQDINGQPYNVVTFRSAITPVKAGEMEIPAATMEGQMIVRGQATGLDPFFDQFFNAFAGMGGSSEHIEARTNRRMLEVLPLPKEGRPENFSGAVGQFTLDAQATPKSVGAGEPVTLHVAVSGRGNFDAIAAPELTEAEGWRTYAPKSSFAAEDSRGFGNSSGTKTFDFSLIARQDQTVTPGAKFSFFDPRDKKYVTLTADPVAVKAKGTTSDATTSTAATTAAASTPTAPNKANTPATTPSADDIAPAAKGLASYAPSFEAHLKSRWFLALNVILLLAVLISMPWLVWMRRRANKSALTSELETALRQAKVACQAASERDAFYNAAAQHILTQLALWDNTPMTQINAQEALSRRVNELSVRRELESILRRHDELKYGGGDAREPLDPQTRTRFLAALEKFSTSHG